MMHPFPLDALLAQWTTEETVLRRRGAVAHPDLLAFCIADLRAAVESYATEELPLAQAADESGLSYKGIQKAVSEGRVPNVGSKHRPRVRRCDLPRKVKPRVWGRIWLGKRWGHHSSGWLPKLDFRRTITWFLKHLPGEHASSSIWM
jgi:hypothetical protein